jgi:hypothetical protein
MHARERMIRERFATLACHACGHAYNSSSVLVLARRHSTWMVMASCPWCEHRAIYVVTFPSRPSSSYSAQQAHTTRIEWSPHSNTPSDLRAESAPSSQPPAGGPITRDDVDQMRTFLDGFDGNFKRTFS